MSGKQHFLLSAKARTLSVRQVMELSDQQAFGLFKELRWGTGDEVACPCCGVVDTHYFIRVRKQWRCRDCGHTFSVTSGTIFAFHKLPLRVYLAAIAIYTNAVKGLSALQLGRDLGVQYKTALMSMAISAPRTRSQNVSTADWRNTRGRTNAACL
ncbi:MAG: IS1595 family transposase [Methyloglobulus sp.]